MELIALVLRVLSREAKVGTKLAYYSRQQDREGLDFFRRALEHTSGRCYGGTMELLVNVILKG